MEGAKSNLFLILFFTFAIIVPIGRARIAEWNEVWHERAEQAREHALKAYTPNPENITSALVKAVHETLKSALMQGLNGTRRNLRENLSGPCQASNPIDKCWRCHPHWASNRKKLADCAMGFGRNAKGGKDGEFYIVTDPSDDTEHPKPGTLRHAVIQNRPLWISFAHDMVIRLHQVLKIQGDKTVDGRGARVVITGGAGISIYLVKNVIVHGLHINNIADGKGKSDDIIQVYGSSDIWIDHVSMSQCHGSLIAVVKGSTAVTISSNHFTDHKEVMLLGDSDKYPQDEKMQVTIAFNHFDKGLGERMPRCRFGFFHVINNDYTHWKTYAIGGSAHPTIISQGNRYVASDAKQVTQKRGHNENTWKHWTWRSEGDLFENGAIFEQSGDDQNWIQTHQDLVYADGVRPAPGSQVAFITKFAGALSCKLREPC